MISFGRLVAVRCVVPRTSAAITVAPLLRAPQCMHAARLQRAWLSTDAADSTDAERRSSGRRANVVQRDLVRSLWHDLRTSAFARA